MEIATETAICQVKKKVINNVKIISNCKFNYFYTPVLGNCLNSDLHALYLNVQKQNT